MGVKVYVSNLSGNKEIKMQQEFVKHVLDCRKIEYEEIDISDPTNEEKKQFMRQTATKKEGQNVPMPPQVYNDDQYAGNHDAFLEANECDELYEFLKLAPPKSKSEAEVTLEPITTPEIVPETPEIENHDNVVLQNKITIKLVNPDQN